jgi:hypothetical protein
MRLLTTDKWRIDATLRSSLGHVINVVDRGGGMPALHHVVDVVAVRVHGMVTAGHLVVESCSHSGKGMLAMLILQFNMKW